VSSSALTTRGGEDFGEPGVQSTVPSGAAAVPLDQLAALRAETRRRSDHLVQLGIICGLDERDIVCVQGHVDRVVVARAELAETVRVRVTGGDVRERVS
jgi:hypothetical protein